MNIRPAKTPASLPERLSAPGLAAALAPAVRLAATGRDGERDSERGRERGRDGEAGEEGGLPPLPALLRAGRVHEVCGPGRRVFAALLAARLAGPVLWIVEARAGELLCPQGLRDFFDPARLVLARPTGLTEVLAAAEEALASGTVPLVVAELPVPPGLTPGRRLQLAAGKGGGRGLCLVPRAAGGTVTAETRWHCRPLPGLGSGQHWARLRDRRGPPREWAGEAGAATARPAGGAVLPDRVSGEATRL